MNRPSQLDLSRSFTKLFPFSEGQIFPVQGGLYAPSIRYHKGTFYIVCTNVIHKPELPATENQYSNFVISTTDIWANEWSNPVFYDFAGIDTSLFWDDDDRVCLVGSASPAPATKIRQFEIDLETGEKLSEDVLLWEGITKVFPEGPHIYKKDGWYYLLIAEGGCFEGHHSIMARSRNIQGPYEANRSNPVMPKTDPTGYIQFTGHGDLFQEPASGQWYFICLGARVSKGGRFIMGRETFITTATWPENEFPVIDFAKLDVPVMGGRKPAPSWPIKRSASSFTPEPDLLHIRNPLKAHYEYSGDRVILTASKADLDQDADAVAFVGKRQRSLNGTASAVLCTQSLAGAGSLKAGLCYYKDEHRFSRIMVDSESGGIAWEVVNRARKVERRQTRSVSDVPDQLTFGVSYTEERLVFWFKSGGSDVKTEAATVDTLEMTNYDFVGPVIGIYAVGEEGVKAHFASLNVD
ncbi:hypothetical protein ACJ41O_007472 [Fusarium nematophilum]